MIDVVYAFDVEDPVNEDADDAAMQISRICSEEGVQACLFTAGEKARVLRQRGRHDVIAAMREHEICYHGNYWAEFPWAALEYGQELSWDEAVRYALATELPGLHDIAEILGQFPVAWCCHQAQQAAPLQYALKLAGVRCWAGGPRGWIMNWLSWPRSNCVVSSQGDWAQHVDPTQRGRIKPTANVATDLAEIQRSFDEVAQTRDFISFAGHPTCWVTSDWGDLYEWAMLFRHKGPHAYPRPANYARSQQRSPEDRAAALELVRQTLRWLKSRSDVRLTTYSELCDRDGEDPVQWLTLGQVIELGRRMRERLTYITDFGTSFSPADVWGMLTFACDTCWRQGKWPERVPVQRLLGHTDPAWAEEGPVTLSRECIFAGALAGYSVMMDERRIMGTLRASFVDVGPGTWVRALSEFVERSVAGEMPLEVTVDGRVQEVEAVKEDVIQERRFGSSNRGPGVSYEKLWEMLRWQAWSFRTAGGTAGNRAG